MTNFSTDADLLKWEPSLMREIILDHQCLTKGESASSQTFAIVAAGGLFITSGVQIGHVIHLKNADQGVDGYYEVLSVESETELMAGLIGGGPGTDEWIPLPTATDLEFRIQTFDPQHEETRWTLLTRFGLEADADRDVAQWAAERRILRRASVALVLATLYRGAAQVVPEVSGLARKAGHYASLYEDEIAKAQLVLDRDKQGSDP